MSDRNQTMNVHDHGMTAAECQSNAVEYADDETPVMVDMYGTKIDGTAVSLDTIIFDGGHTHLRVNGEILFE